MKTTFGSIAVVLSLACLAHGPPAGAATYVVLSLIDRQLTVVKATGPADGGVTSIYPRRDGAFDLAALKAADAAIHGVQPEAKVIALATTDPKIYALQDKWVEGSSVDVAQLARLLGSQLAAEPDARLVVIAGHRADPTLPNGETLFKAGRKVSGLGFYVEASARLQREDGREPPPGFIAAFTSLRMVLIDTRTLTVEADEAGSVAITRSAMRSTFANDPWNAMTDRERVGYLEQMIASEIGRMTPVLLRERKR